MSIKRRLRRAFNRTAPNDLDSILRSCPAPSAAAPGKHSGTVLPSEKPKSRRKERLLEFAATAASLALLIGTIAGGVWYFRSQLYRDNTLMDDPVSSTAPASSGTEQTEIISVNVDIEEELIPWIWELFWPGEEEIDRDANTTVVCLSPDDPSPDDPSPTAASIYLVWITHNGYTFRVECDGLSLELLSVELLENNSEKIGYITESAAEAIAQLQVGSDFIPAGCWLVTTANTAYYCLWFEGRDVALDTVGIECYINAKTGALIDIGQEIEPGYTVGPPYFEEATPPDGKISTEAAIEIATSGCSGEVYNIEVRYESDADGNGRYLILFDDEQDCWEVAVDAFSAEILSRSATLMKEFSLMDSSGEALSTVGVSFIDITELKVSADGNYYMMYAADSTTGYTIRVNRFGGRVQLDSAAPLSESVEIPDGAIGAGTAIGCALEHAGLTEAQLNSIGFVLNAAQGRYEICLECGSDSYIFEIDACTGDVLSYYAPTE